MRGGEERQKEDWAAGTRAALAGGVALVVDQPNTVPPITTTAQLEARIGEARSEAVCHFAVNGALMADCDFKGLWRAGAALFGEGFLAPSTRGDAIEAGQLRDLIARVAGLGATASIHAEEILPLADTNPLEHALARPAAGEERAIGQAIAANAAGCRLHFCHLSTAGAVMAARGRGTLEVTPHHLLLSLEAFMECGGRGKVNPPLRSEGERQELFRSWDAIDVVASDHAPHTSAEKAAPWESAPAGLPGVETMLPLLVYECLQGSIDLPSLIAKTSRNPAAILGVQPPGLSVGDRADIAIFPREPTKITAEALHSKAGWTPFEGRNAVFPETVCLAGECVYRGGEYQSGHPMFFPGKGLL
jgi:dihydroorotase